jgi:hypothetical protein
MTLVHGLVAGAALVACGVFTVAWRRDGAGALAALLPLTAGVAVSLAAAGRYAGRLDPDTGQELACLVCVMGLATAIVGAAWTRGSVAR